jgi:chemotaxis protein methyltransferase CheR
MSNVEKVDPNLELILNKITDSAEGQMYALSFLTRRIEHRMRARGIRSYQEYSNLLSADPSEKAALTSLFSITVTEFFRDINFFEMLRFKILPSILFENSSTKSGSSEVKIWCAGCATGEEPYSIAILVSELINQESHRIKIYATDINPDSIKIARTGIYEQRSLKNMSNDIMSKYFCGIPSKKDNDKLKYYQISQAMREAVVFNSGDLATLASPTSDLDIIMCRNVMIYFDKGSKDKLLKKFYDALKPKGYFVMGQSEIITGKTFSIFKTIHPKERIYQKN